jgi:hypothetical protein
MNYLPTFVAIGAGSFLGRLYVNSRGITDFWQGVLIQGGAIVVAVFLVNFISGWIQEARKR